MPSPAPHNIARAAGFTLLEVLIAITIIAVMTGLIVWHLTAATTSYSIGVIVQKKPD